MKKHLLIAIAICVLFLSACGSVVGTSSPSSNPASHSTAPNVTASAQSVCQVLYDRQTQLSQEYHAVSVLLTRAQAEENVHQIGDTEQRLIRLHQSIVQVQAQLKAC